jgi:hypothetical protein
LRDYVIYGSQNPTVRSARCVIPRLTCEFLSPALKTYCALATFLRKSRYNVQFPSGLSSLPLWFWMQSRTGRSYPVSPRFHCILSAPPILKRSGRAPLPRQCVSLCPNRSVALSALTGHLRLLPGFTESTSSLSCFSPLMLVAYPALNRFVDFGVLAHGGARSFGPPDVFLAQPVPSRSTHTRIEPEQTAPCL